MALEQSGPAIGQGAAGLADADAAVARGAASGLDRMGEPGANDG